MNRRISDQHVDVSWETVAYYLRRGQSVVYPLSTDQGRNVTYEIDATDASVSLLVELPRGERCPRSPSSNIEVTEVVRRRVRSARIRTTSPDLMRDFHDLAFAVAERVTRDATPLAKALLDTIRSWHRLIDVRAVQLGRQLGLHGELAVLQRIALENGWRTAVDSWLGPHGEIHDFSLPDFDLEVKTTASEFRKHTVNGLDQLTPKLGRNLWCVSIQLARGGTAGRTLGESIDACLVAARKVSAEAETRLTMSLEAAGAEGLAFSAGSEESRWTIRSVPLILGHLDTPRIDSAALRDSLSDRISKVSYDIDLTGLSAAPDAPVDPKNIRLP